MNEFYLGYSTYVVYINFVYFETNRRLCIRKSNNRDFGHCFRKSSNSKLFRYGLLTLTVIEVINVCNLNGVSVVREKICESSLIKRIRNNRSASVNEFNLCYGTDVVCIGFANFKTNARLCFSRIYKRDFGNCFCERSKLDINAFGCVCIRIFCNQRVCSARKKFFDTC